MGRAPECRNDALFDRLERRGIANQYPRRSDGSFELRRFALSRQGFVRGKNPTYRFRNRLIGLPAYGSGIQGFRLIGGYLQSGNLVEPVRSGSDGSRMTAMTRGRDVTDRSDVTAGGRLKFDLPLLTNPERLFVPRTLFPILRMVEHLMEMRALVNGDRQSLIRRRFRIYQPVGPSKNRLYVK